MDRDFNGFIPPFMDFNNQTNMNSNPNIFPELNELYKDPIMNPIMQYEQAYSYYKYLCMQIDYKIKCKEYEKMCKEELGNNSERKRQDLHV